ncbi:MAG: hypothetical protein GF353_05400 [Candidatus Lokiarchaeota archaeon]|nr:hypothetical protein [Candidatus Lokiarchaeota archaeon]
MLEDLLIVNNSDQVLYSWHPDNRKNAMDDLVGGFLSALNGFATVERGEDIKFLRLKETFILFEKHEEFNLTFITTTKNEEMIELLHALTHRLMEEFVSMFEYTLKSGFTVEITQFKKFDNIMADLINDYGLDLVHASSDEPLSEEKFDSIMFLEPKGGNILFFKSKNYLPKEKISFLIPLIINTAKLLYSQYMDTEAEWINLSNIDGESLHAEHRDQILIVKSYRFSVVNDKNHIAPRFLEESDKYVKKHEIISYVFKNLEFDESIMQVFLIDDYGKIMYASNLCQTSDFSDYVPETISFLTATKKTSEEIFSKRLSYSVIGGKKFGTMYLNLINSGLVLIIDLRSIKDISEIHGIYKKIFNQLLKFREDSESSC